MTRLTVAHGDLVVRLWLRLLAAPVGDTRWARARALRRAVDEVVCLHPTMYLHAAGPWYRDCRDVTANGLRAA